MQAALPIAYALFLWWFSTGLIFYLDSLPTRTFRLSMAGATLIFALALGVIWNTAEATDTQSIYLAFTAGVLCWGWQAALLLLLQQVLQVLVVQVEVTASCSSAVCWVLAGRATGQELLAACAAAAGCTRHTIGTQSGSRCVLLVVVRGPRWVLQHTCTFKRVHKLRADCCSSVGKLWCWCCWCCYWWWWCCNQLRLSLLHVLPVLLTGLHSSSELLLQGLLCYSSRCHISSMNLSNCDCCLRKL